MKNISILLITFSLFLTACSSEQTPKTTAQTEAKLEKAPSFEVTTIAGETVSLQQSMDENKPTVVYFTASWCPVCAKNWPILTEVYPEYKDRLNLVAIGIDPTDTEEVMRKLSKEKGFKFPITKGHPEIMLAFGVKAQATTVGINRNGEVLFQKDKVALSAEDYRALFDELLK